MTKFDMDDFVLARVPADTPAVEASQKRWPSACWIRLGPEVVFYRRPSGVALKPVMAALRDMLDQASIITADWVRTRDKVPDGARLAPIGPAMSPEEMGTAAVQCSAVFYRNYDGRHGGGPRIVMGSPDPFGDPITLEGARAPIETSPP